MERSLPPVATARTAGALYLAVVVLSIFALGAVQGLIEPTDPLRTSDNLAGRAAEFRLAVVANLVASLCYIAVVGLLNELLKPVQPGISRLAVLFGLSGCIIGATTAALQLTAPAMLTVVDSTATAPAAHALLVAGGRATGVGLTMFGCYCLLLGWLVFRSGFIPSILGALLILSGATWLAGNLALLLEPALTERFLLIVGVAALGEILFTMWLLFKGVDAARWQASARRHQEGDLAA
ncbi:MAG TPA: DUF4386 domain-containing protein [Allosphingosinicella sp.]|jgi:hypothetical protein